MKNRAKCKLCSSIIESFHPNDHVLCKCGEIELNGGEAMLTKANDYSNFIRVDDLGNETAVQYRQHPKEEASHAGVEKPQEGLRKKDLLELLQEMIDNEEKLPTGAKEAHLNTYDLLRYMILIKQIFEREDPHD